MIKYNVKLNNGVEALNINEKSVSAEEVVENVDAKFMAHHMHLHNPPSQRTWPPPCSTPSARALPS